ncbi:hypothetical protein ACFSVJ_01110 [Prauserella oleivorans]
MPRTRRGLDARAGAPFGPGGRRRHAPQRTRGPRPQLPHPRRHPALRTPGRGRAEVAGYGGEIVDGRVVTARRTDDGTFTVELADGGPCGRDG